MDESSDRVPELSFIVANAVAADHGASGLDHLREAAGEDALQNFKISLVGEADQRERGQRAAAHGIDIAEGVGGGDLAESVRVVDDGSEEIDGLHQRLIRRDLIYSGVVGVVEAD